MLATARSLQNVGLEHCLAATCLKQRPQLVVGGNGVSGQAFVDNKAFREYAFKDFEANVLDMETAATAMVAHSNGVPYIAFRSLSDLAGGGDGENEMAPSWAWRRPIRPRCCGPFWQPGSERHDPTTGLRNARSPSPLAGEGLGRGGAWKPAPYFVPARSPLSPTLSRKGRGSPGHCRQRGVRRASIAPPPSRGERLERRGAWKPAPCLVPVRSLLSPTLSHKGEGVLGHCRQRGVRRASRTPPPSRGRGWGEGERGNWRSAGYQRPAPSSPTSPARGEGVTADGRQRVADGPLICPTYCASPTSPSASVSSSPTTTSA